MALVPVTEVLPAETQTELTLVALAEDIGAAHDSVIQATSSAVCYAVRAGALLLQAKPLVPHGQWVPWMQAHLTFSVRTAQAYMRLASTADADATRVAHLPLRQALRLIATPSISNTKTIETATTTPTEISRAVYQKYIRSRKRADRTNRFAVNFLVSLDVDADLVADVSDAEIEALDPAVVPTFIASLRTTASAYRRLARRIELRGGRKDSARSIGLT